MAMLVDPARSAPPSLDELGRDLLRVTGVERVLSILRPLLCFALYFVFAFHGWWIPAIAAVAGLMFITYVSTSHDLLHRTLGFSRRINDAWLFLIEALVLRSGHAFRATHLQHHRHFPDHDDVEGRVARLSWWHALLHGIGHQTRLFLWTWREKPQERPWLAAEASVVAVAIAASFAAWNWSIVPGIYVILVITSSWLYPLATVWIPHRHEGASPLTQTIAVRGRWIPELLLQHTYHLEHHLYPSVSSHRWPELARRLDPWLRTQGVNPLRLP
jgi:beta-carotene hydroxylase